MMKALTFAIVGAGGLLCGISDADAQSCYPQPRRVRRYAPQRYDSGYYFGYGTPRVSVTTYRAPRHYSSRHCGRCQPSYERVWVNQPRYQRVFVGYDRCGRPVYQTVCISRGHYATRTRYVCY